MSARKVALFHELEWRNVDAGGRLADLPKMSWRIGVCSPSYPKTPCNQPPAARILIHLEAKTS